MPGKRSKSEERERKRRYRQQIGQEEKTDQSREG